MRRSLMSLVAILASLFIAGCGSSGNSADAPPAGITLLPGDGMITATWAMTSGVEYWMFYAPSTSISTSNWTKIPGSQSGVNVSSPFVAAGLTNGTVYSFTLNARTDGGAGGTSTPSVSAVPRLAGTATVSSPVPWVAGTALGTGDLRGLALGTAFVAVGAGGAMYSSPDGVTWSAIVSPVATNLNAAAYAGQYNAVGDGGVIVRSADATTWAAAASSGTATTNNLYGVGGGIGKIVAVGAAGTIISTLDGTTWTAPAGSGTATTNDLYAVRSHGNNLWIAVGAKGTILTSADAITWTPVVSNTALDLKSITYGINTATGAGIFVAVGAGGALVTSPDAVTWTAQTAIGAGARALSAVTYGTQFIAVGAGGSIYTSTDAINWTSQPSASASNLNAIAPAIYRYSVVGAAGTNLLAK